MIFRFSASSLDRKPLREAFKRKYSIIDERTVSDPKLLISGEKEWYAHGSNHRLENGHLKRDLEKSGWFIEIRTLRELMKFMALHGDNKTRVQLTMSHSETIPAARQNFVPLIWFEKNSA